MANWKKAFAKIIGDLMDRGFRGPLRSPTGAWCMMPAVPAFKNCRSRSRCGCLPRALEAGGIALERARAAISFRLSPPMPISSDDREISRAAAAMGAGRSGVRA